MNRILIALVMALLCGNLIAQAPPEPGSGSMPPDTQAPPAQTTPSTSIPPADQSSPASAPSTAPTTSAASPSRIAPGSVIPVQLTKSIDARKAKTGDEVVAKVTQDLRNDAGTVIVTKDTRVVGHVTEAQARTKEQKESEVAIAFDRVVPKNGEPMQMPMSIQAIIAPPNATANSNAAGTQPTSSYPGAGGSPPAGRSGSMGGTTPTASAPQTTGSVPADTSAGAPAQQSITGNTKGVVGISNLSLSTAADTTQGSVVSSQKNNVKLDDGTVLLLRVNQ